MKKYNQSTITDIHYNKLLRQQVSFSRNQSTIQECIQLLLKDPTIRIEQENEKLGLLLRGHEFFRMSDSNFLKECCQVVTIQNQVNEIRIVPKKLIDLSKERFQQEQSYQSQTKKLINFIIINILIIAIIQLINQKQISLQCIILTGDVVLNKGNQEILLLQHFGSNLLILGSEYYSEMPDWNVISKTPCKAATISRHDFRVNLLTSEVCRVTKEISLIYNFPIFKNVPYSKVRKFYANSVTQTFQCLDIVYLQEQMAKQIYLVIDGIFELRELEKGVAKAVHIYTQGSLIGENELQHQSSFRNGTAFCISEEGLLLLFDSEYFQDHVIPEIIDNIPKSCLIQYFNQKDSSKNKVVLVEELNQKRTISRQYNFRRSFDNLDTFQNQQLANTKLIKQRKSSQSFNYQKSNLLGDTNQIFINNFQQQITNQPEFIQNIKKQHQAPNFSELNQTTKRKSQKSTRILNDYNENASNIIESPNPFIVNRKNQFLQTTQKIKQTNTQFQKKLKQQFYPIGTLNNELLNKFLNCKEEYSDIAAKNRMNRTQSQTNKVKKTININK